MKKIVCILLALVLITAIITNVAYAEGNERGWFCKRCGNSQPPITAEEELINKYGGYSVDRSVGDDSDEKIIYLTFDLGYENGNTEKILDTLKEENVPAAFFVLDNIILQNSDLVTRMASEGHLLCNHTKNHTNISRLTKDEIAKNLTELEEICEQKTGVTMSKYFRFPEGRYSEYALSVLQELGYKSIFWSFAYADWDNNKQPAPTKAIEKIMSNTHNGAVLLLHSTSDTNAKIMPELIKRWKELGFTFGTLDELIRRNT